MTKQELKNLISKASSKQKDTPWINDGALVDILSGIVDAIPEGGGSSEHLIIDNAVIDQAPGSAFAGVTAEDYATITNALDAGRSVFINTSGEGYLQVFSNLGSTPFFLVSDTQDEAPRCCYIQVNE